MCLHLALDVVLGRGRRDVFFPYDRNSKLLDCRLNDDDDDDEKPESPSRRKQKAN